MVRKQNFTVEDNCKIAKLSIKMGDHFYLGNVKIWDSIIEVVKHLWFTYSISSDEEGPQEKDVAYLSWRKVLLWAAGSRRKDTEAGCGPNRNLRGGRARIPKWGLRGRWMGTREGPSAGCWEGRRHVWNTQLCGQTAFEATMAKLNFWFCLFRSCNVCRNKNGEREIERLWNSQIWLPRISRKSL